MFLFRTCSHSCPLSFTAPTPISHTPVCLLSADRERKAAKDNWNNSKQPIIFSVHQLNSIPNSSLSFCSQIHRKQFSLRKDKEQVYSGIILLLLWTFKQFPTYGSPIQTSNIFETLRSDFLIATPIEVKMR